MGGESIAEGAERAIQLDSRAPMTHAFLESVEERVDYIGQLMADRKWTPEVSRMRQRELAEAWKLEASTIRNYSAEAGRAIAEGIKEQRAAIAARSIDRLEELAISCADSPIPGDSGAAARANEILLKAAGFAEPEEDKSRGTTIQVVGTVITSPAMKALVGGAKKLNGGANGHSNGHASAEGAHVVPAPNRDGGMVPGRGNGSGMD